MPGGGAFAGGVFGGAPDGGVFGGGGLGGTATFPACDGVKPLAAAMLLPGTNTKPFGIRFRKALLTVPTAAPAAPTPPRRAAAKRPSAGPNHGAERREGRHSPLPMIQRPLVES